MGNGGFRQARVHLFIVGLLSVFTGLRAQLSAQPKAGVLCFGPPDNWHEVGWCFTAKARLQSCGYDVLFEMNPTPGEIARLKEHRPFERYTPVFTFSHGMIDRRDDSHYLVSSHGGRASYYRTAHLLRDVDRSIPHASQWLSSCHAGRAVEEIGFNVGSDSAAEEFTYAATYQQSPPVSALLDLLCDVSLFERYADSSCTMQNLQFQYYFADRLPHREDNEYCTVALSEYHSDSDHYGRVDSSAIAAEERGCQLKYQRLRRTYDKPDVTVTRESLFVFLLKFRSEEAGQNYVTPLGLFRNADEAETRMRQLYPHWPASCGNQTIGDEFFRETHAAVHCEVLSYPFQKVYVSTIRVRSRNNGGRPSTQIDGTSVTPHFDHYSLRHPYCLTEDERRQARRP